MNLSIRNARDVPPPREVIQAFIVRRKRTQMRPDDLSNPGEFRLKNSKNSCSDYT